MMIRQRLSNAFCQQNWALVVVELVAPMLGVFLALLQFSLLLPFKVEAQAMLTMLREARTP